MRNYYVLHYIKMSANPRLKHCFLIQLKMAQKRQTVFN